MPLAGKHGRINVTGVGAVGYMSSWRARMRRERLDTTNFESVTLNGNVYSEGLTGVLDTTFTVEGYCHAGGNLLVYYPQDGLVHDFLFRKTSPLGYLGVECDVLGFEPGGNVRDRFTFTAELQSNGLVV